MTVICVEGMQSRATLSYYGAPFAIRYGTLVYSLLGIYWVMAGSMREEIWAWKGICCVKKHFSLIHIATFWVV